jgi:GxxExxY protein
MRLLVQPLLYIKKWGRGLLESVYHECLKLELEHRKINFFTEMKILVIYREKVLDTIFRCDLFVEGCIVVELKAVKDFTQEFEAKLLNHMNLLKAPKGILINFNCNNIFYEGQRTYVNDYFRTLPD